MTCIFMPVCRAMCEGQGAAPVAVGVTGAGRA